MSLGLSWSPLRTRLLAASATAWLAPLALAAVLHAPHDNAYSVAVGILPDGRQEVVVVTDDQTVLSSRDGLLTFGLVSGGGLDTVRPTCVTYNPSIPWANGLGFGVFFIGTEKGIYKYEPSADQGLGPVYDLSTGLPASGNGRLVKAIVSPDGVGPGAQPTFAIMRDGKVYSLNYDGASWVQVFNSGVTVSYAALAFAHEFDRRAAFETAYVFLGINDKLYRSNDGGTPGTWQLVHQFPGWFVLSIGTDWDYGPNWDANLYVGLGKEAPFSNTGDKGEVHVSYDDGETFSRVLRVDTSVMTIVGTPAGPQQPPTVYLAGREYPNVNGYRNSGILMSRDGGSTFDDEGNDQSFELEHDPGHASGFGPLRYVAQLLPMPDYAQTGRILYARNEGLYISPNEGGQWWQVPMRGVQEVRNVVTARDAANHLHVFGASYGQGTLNHNLADGTEYTAPTGMGQVFTLPIAVSPNFATDGACYAGGTSGIGAWFDPTVDPPVNGMGVTGAKTMPLQHEDTGIRLLNYIRSMALSPNFNAAVGSPDQVMYFGGWEGDMYRSLDAGMTYRDANTVLGGGELPYIISLAFAPSFIASGAHNDVYACGQDGTIWRMTNNKWELVTDLNESCNALIVDPLYDPLDNRRIWVATNTGSGVKEILDNAVPQVSTTGAGLPFLRVTGLDVRYSGGETWVYASTWADGLYRVRLVGEQPWERLTNDGYPRTFTKGLALAHAWPLDSRVFAATGDGIFVLDEQSPTPSWKPLLAATVWDNREASILTYSPNAVGVDPNQPTEWVSRGSAAIAGGVFGEDTSQSEHDGDYLLFHGWAKRVAFHTWAGPSYGSITLSARRIADGSALGSVSFDLKNEPPGRFVAELDLGLAIAEPIVLRIDIAIDGNETVLHDGVQIVQ